jgi:hypothetical protein
MPRPGVGNPGNKGGKPYIEENRDNAATLKGLVMDWATKVLRLASTQKKEAGQSPVTR